METGAEAKAPGPPPGSPTIGGPDAGKQPNRPPGLVPHVRLPELHLPGGTPGRMLWWGGLATVAAFGVVDWPVAGLIGVGTWVAERSAKHEAAAAREPLSPQQP